MDNCKVIWSNYNLDVKDWKEDILSEHPDFTESDCIEYMYELNSYYLDDERINLHIQLPRPIIVIADLGRWNGRSTGYKEIESGVIADCLYSDTDYSTWYVDKNGDLRCDAVHHDSSNHYLYRTYKENATETQIENLKDKIFDGTVTRADITRITKKLGPVIANVYGW